MKQFNLYDWQTLPDIRDCLFFFLPEEQKLLQNQPHFSNLFSLFEESNKVEIGDNSVCKGIYSLPYSFEELTEKPYLLTKLRQFLQQKLDKTTARYILFYCDEIALNRIDTLKAILLSYYNLAYNPSHLGFKQKSSEYELACLVSNEQQKSDFSVSHREISYLASSMIYARKWADLPSDIATPAAIAEHLSQYSHQHQLKIQLLDQQALQEKGLHSLYTVGKSGLNSPYLVQIDYQGLPNNEDFYCFVGKGITFDTGGLWLKTGDGMKTMKYDMCGATILMGLLNAVVQNQLPVNLRIIVGLAENMLNEKAMRPGDIVKSYSGKSIEIINTDAEGRLILADLLAFAAAQKPKAIIDVATLTGAVVKALGYDISGMMSNNEQLVQQFSLASQQSKERIWQLPCDESFIGQVESQIADYCNTPPNNAAICVSAGFFLSRFVGNYPWIHFDVSGTALYRDKSVYASGKPIYLLYQFVKNLSISGEENE